MSICRVKYLYVYTLSILVQSGIRVRKHSDIIYSNITVQVHCYHGIWSNIIWILHHWSAKVRFTRDVQCIKLVDAHELGWNLKSWIKGIGWEDPATKSSRFRCTLWSTTGISPKFKLQNLNIQVQGLLEKQPNEYIKWVSNGVHRQHTCTGNKCIVYSSQTGRQ